jgi:ABC-type antimicrobial peptide transport system permease subunit
VSTFLLALGAIALALAAVGIYGVMAQSVTQQQREIGIRMALGASRVAVVGMVIRSGLLLVGIGMLIGAPLAFLMFRATIQGFNLFDVEIGYGVPAALFAALALVGVVSVVVPARRASAVAPARALKE